MGPLLAHCLLCTHNIVEAIDWHENFGSNDVTAHFMILTLLEYGGPTPTLRVVMNLSERVGVVLCMYFSCE